jgi:dolichol-phosphate mannosyltransferase
MKLISIVIPVYRNEGSIALTYHKILAVLKTIQERYTYEFVFVNDGSDDNSYNELIKLTHLDDNIQVISFSRNFGQVAAFIAGHRHAKGDLSVYVSADLQDPPELILKMLQQWEAGNEIVICHRIDRDDKITAKIASKVFYLLMKLVNNKMPEGGFDYCLLDRQAIDKINAIDERNRFIQGDILWLGFNVAFIPYSRLKRIHGKSQWSISKKIKYFIDGVINTSYLPIRFMSAIGIIISLVGFAYAIAIAYARFINKTPFNGYAPIMITLLIVGGLIMIMLGIIGEYLWRVYDETRKRPEYIIKEKLTNK